MKKMYAAIDLGATSGRIIIGDGEKDMREIHRFPSPMLRTERGIFWDFARLSKGVLDGLKKLDPRRDGVISVSCDSWAQDFGLLDADDKLLQNPFCYRDEQSEIFTGRRLEFIERTQPELRQKARCLLHIADLIHHLLCGAKRNNFTLAAYGKIAIDHELFGSLADSEIIGSINHPELPLLAGIPVISGAGHDTAAAYCGGGIRENELIISLGTWYMMGEPWDGREPAPGFSKLPLPGKKWALTAGGMGMWPFQQCVRIWKEKGIFPGYEKLDALAGASAVTGSVDPDEPSLFAPENMEEAIFALIGKRLDPGDCSALLLRGIAAKLGRSAAAFGRDFRRVVLVGGASGSMLMRELISREIAAPLVPGNSEASAFGNICIQKQVITSR